MQTKITPQNFYIASTGLFILSTPPLRRPDYSNEFSKYWFEGGMLYRESNHWYKVGFCYWPLKGENGTIEWRQIGNYKAHNPFLDGQNVILCGRVPFADMLWQELEPANVKQAINFFSKREDYEACAEIQKIYQLQKS